MGCYFVDCKHHELQGKTTETYDEHYISFCKLKNECVTYEEYGSCDSFEADNEDE